MKRNFVKRTRIILFGKESKAISRMVEAHGFVLVKFGADFIISYGGDGTLMQAEHKFPGIPKIILKRSLICKRCLPVSNDEILKRVAQNHFKVEDLIKLAVRVGAKNLIAINDIIVHNEDPRHTIRYRLWIDNRPIGNEIIGDGVVIATPFGSTGYYRSITDSFFELGIGVAFNNSTEQADHMIIKNDSLIKIKLIRGSAVIYADNEKASIKLKVGDEAVITKSLKKFKFVNVLP